MMINRRSVLAALLGLAALPLAACGDDDDDCDDVNSDESEEDDDADGRRYGKPLPPKSQPRQAPARTNTGAGSRYSGGHSYRGR